MDYRFVKGVREGSQLLLVLPENMLYVLKCTRNDAKEYICYQTILAAPKKGDENNCNHIKCNARVKLKKDGVCERMKMQHTNHESHESIFRDLEKRNNMKSSCRLLKNRFSEDSHKISVRHIFQREIAKYMKRIEQDYLL